MGSTHARAVLIDAARLICTGAGSFAVGDVDDSVWELAARSGLAQLLAVAQAAANNELISAAAPADVRGAVRWASVNHLQTLAELRMLAGRFDKAGIRWLVLKGPVLCDVVYARPGMRAYGDLDVLVHPTDLPAALEVLLDEDTQLIDRNWAHIRHTEQCEISVRLPFGTALDLHWHVISDPRIRAEIGLPIGELFQRAMHVQVGGVSVQVLDPIDMLCHLCLHAALSGGHQLRWLVDIQQTVAWARPDPGELARRSTQLGCALVLAVMLQRVARHLDPGVLPLLRATRRQNAWTMLCAGVDRAVALDPDDTAYSGRAIFSATRATPWQSMQAAARTVRAAAASGRSRRGRVIDASVLHDEGGDYFDRAAWLAIAGSHA